MPTTKKQPPRKITSQKSFVIFGFITKNHVTGFCMGVGFHAALLQGFGLLGREENQMGSAGASVVAASTAPSKGMTPEQKAEFFIRTLIEYQECDAVAELLKVASRGYMKKVHDMISTEDEPHEPLEMMGRILYSGRYMPQDTVRKTMLDGIQTVQSQVEQAASLEGNGQEQIQKPDVELQLHQLSVLRDFFTKQKVPPLEIEEILPVQSQIETQIQTPYPFQLQRE